MHTFGISTSIVQGNMELLPSLERFPHEHVEVGFFREELLATVMEFLEAGGRGYGFHDPLPWHPEWRWPSLTDPDETERARSLRVVEHTLGTASRYRPVYVLTHFPSVHFEPVEGWDEAATRAAAGATAETLQRWSREAGLPILLENVGPNPYWQAEYWSEVFDQYPSLQFCLDIGHLALEAHARQYDALRFVEQVARHTTQLHVYNATPEAYQAFHHVPIHPEQTPADGWMDLPGIADALRRGGAGDLRIVFEHTPQYPVDEAYVLEGMDWVRELFVNGEW